MKILSSKYTAEFDSVDKDSWFDIVQMFDDANIYQTWSYGVVRVGRNNISHFILKKNGTIVAAAQARIAQIPFINIGIAYIQWGPLWRLHGKPENKEVFCQAIRALRNEYVRRRGLVLRILPVLFNDESDIFLSLLKQEGYAWQADSKRQRTLLVNLSHSLEDLRKGLNRKWRNHLNKAEKNQLELIEGHDDHLLEMFMEIYTEMLDRKKYVTFTNIEDYRSAQKDLPDGLKMKIFICRSNGNLCAGAICSAIGNTGIYLFGATSDIGMKSKGSYLLQWKILEWLKTKNCDWYNLHGINPIANPGTYSFKVGLCGKNGKEVQFLGQFDAYKNPLSFVSVKCGDFLKTQYRKSKEVISNVRFFRNSRDTAA